MVKVSSKLVERKIGCDEKVTRLYKLLESDAEIQSYLQMANTMAVNRLQYNDHGPVHSRIAGGTALEIYDIIRNDVKPNIIHDGIGDESDARLVTFCGAYLHDIGNAIHRESHNINGCIVANPILKRLLGEIYGMETEKVFKLKQEILQSIFSHNEEVTCLTVEAGISKIADGCDMAEGRARIPYKLGKVDIHSLSALSITKVEVEPGADRSLLIKVHMKNYAGVFQIEEVLMKKIKTSGLKDNVRVLALEKGRVIKRSP